MRKLGISVYPSNSSLEENIKYLDLCHKHNYSRLFVCFISLFNDNKIDEAKLAETKIILQHAKKLNYEVVVDVNAQILKTLNADVQDLSWFSNLGVSGIRLDIGFGGSEEALMTYNKENILIELNVSSNNAYLDNVVSYQANLHNLIGCHNFYPKKRSGLTRDLFEKCSLEYKKYGIRVAAFVNSQNATFGPWPVAQGLCTLEEHRYLPIDVQAKDLFYSNLVDDVIIANCFASEKEIKKLASVKRDIITLDVDLEYSLSEVEKKIAFDELHIFRGDASSYAIRSTWPRITYKKDSIKPQNTRDICYGDVFIENDSYKNYKGELLIALDDYHNDGTSNVIGKVSEDNLMLLPHISPWSKFKLALKNNTEQ